MDTSPARPPGGRVCAVVLLALALLHLVGLPAHARIAAYLGMLFAAVAVGFGVAAGRLWWGYSFDGQVLAASLSLLALGGQLLALFVGLPGVPQLRGHVTPLGVLAMVLEAAIVAVLLAGRRPISRG